MSMNFNDIAILNVKSQHYCCIISTFSKNEAINLMQKIYPFDQKTEPYKTSILLSYMKVGKETLTFADIEIGKNEFYRHKTPIF